MKSLQIWRFIERVDGQHSFFTISQTGNKLRATDRCKMKIWKYIIVAALLSLWFSGCATPTPDFQVPQALKEKPVVCLYEAKGNERGTCKIMYQGNHLVTLRPDTYFVHYPDPGEVTYLLPRPDELAEDIDNSLTLGLVKDQKSFSTTFMAEAGKVYYFKVQGLYLARVEEAMALADLAKCHKVKGAKSH